MESETTTPELLNVEKIFAAKNPRLHRMLPKWIFRLIRKIIHEDELNRMNGLHWRKEGLEFVDGILGELGVKVEFAVASPEGESVNDPAALAHLLKPGRKYLLASNHPLGGLDGMALLQAAGKARRDVVFPVNDLLLFIPSLRTVFIPINKHGKNTENVEQINDTFTSEKIILYFPAGLVSRKDDSGKVEDLEWKKTFISKAVQSHRDILPVYISGANSNTFYNLARWRKRLGIKANIEMMLLPHEMIRQRGQTIRILFGDPVPWETFDKTRSTRDWAAFMKEKSYALADRIHHLFI